MWMLIATFTSPQFRLAHELAVCCFNIVLWVTYWSGTHHVAHVLTNEKALVAILFKRKKGGFFKINSAECERVGWCHWSKLTMNFYWLLPSLFEADHFSICYSDQKITLASFLNNPTQT
jgi:hypothetical protein